MRIIIGILVVLVVFTIGVCTYGYFNAATILSNIMSKKLQVPVAISSVHFGDAEFSLYELQIANPKKAKMPTALKAKTIDVKAPYLDYFKNPIVIDEIHIDQIYVNIELYNKDQSEGNWQTILGQMHEDHGGFFSIQRESVIKTLLLTNIYIDLILSDGKLHRLSPIERLEFHDVTSEKGIPMHEISEIIVQKMMHSIFLEKGLQTIIEAPANIIKGLFPFFGSSQKSLPNPQEP